MLIAKSTVIEKGDIVTFKVVNGDEIVAEVSQVTPDGWILRRPCTVVPSPQGIGLLQSLFTGSLEEVPLDRQHVILYAKTVEDITRHYLSTTSGIATVSSGQKSFSGLAL